MNRKTSKLIVARVQNLFAPSLLLLGSLLALSGCVSTEIKPQDCPANTQQLAGCPPVGAVQDAEIAKLYAQRSWGYLKGKDFDPVVFGRDAKIPVNDALIKLLDSTDDGALKALAARIWMIENAQHTLDVMYYIYRDDLVGHAIFGALCDAVERGVDIRFMVDSLGSSSLKKNNMKALESCVLNAGFMRNRAGDITVYKARIQPVIFNSPTSDGANLNRRSHDKLIIVDGHFPGKSYAITGGRNASLDYYGILEDGSPNTHSYRDVDLLLHGPDKVDSVEPYSAPLGLVVEAYYSILFLFDKNKRLSMTRMGDPGKTYLAQRNEFRNKLAALKSLPIMKPVFLNINKYMTEDYHQAEVLLAHELGNLINENVVTEAVENLNQSSNSIVHILRQVHTEKNKHIRIVSPYLFAAKYTDKNNKVVIDGAQDVLDWLEQNPENTLEIVTNSVLTSDNFFTQSVIDLDLAPRLLLSEAATRQWTADLENSELNPAFIESDEWRRMVNHPRLKIYETGKLDDVIFGGDYHHSKLHAKYIIGDEVGFVGTSNFDYRSRLYNNEMGFFFRSKDMVRDIARNTDYLVSLSYLWGSPEWLEMRQRLRQMDGMKASTTKHQRGIYKTIKNTGLMWLF